MGKCGILFSLQSVQSRFNPVDANGFLEKNKASTSLYDISLEYFPCHFVVFQLRDFAEPVICLIFKICLLCDPQYNPFSDTLPIFP